MKKILILSIPVLIILTTIFFILFYNDDNEPKIITGLVENTEIDIASKIPGRVQSIYFNEGDSVKQGEVIAKLESKELDSKVEQAKYGVEAAKSKYNLALKGARDEEKIAAEKLYLQAKHQFELAEKTQKRISALFKDSVISNQEMDQVEFQYKVAKEQMDAARSKFDMALNGARQEEKQGAFSLYQQAENVYKEVLSYQSELEIKAPINGIISKRIINAGEIAASGYPIFTISDHNDFWVTLNLKESDLSSIKMGKILKGKMPSFDNKEFDFEVYYISPMGDFATWKPTNQKGEFDLKTFEIRLRPKKKIDGIKSGMTVNIEIRK